MKNSICILMVVTMLISIACPAVGFAIEDDADVGTVVEDTSIDAVYSGVDDTVEIGYPDNAGEEPVAENEDFLENNAADNTSDGDALGDEDVNADKTDIEITTEENLNDKTEVDSLTETSDIEQEKSEDQQVDEIQSVDEVSSETDQEVPEQPEAVMMTTSETVVVTDGLISLNGDSLYFDSECSQDLDLNFSLSPYSGIRSESIEITNNGDTSIIISTSDIMKLHGPDIVSKDKFKNWKNLTKTQTRENIALGIKINNMKCWFEAEGTSLELYILEPGETIILEMTAKYGLAWSEEVEIEYQCSLIFTTIPYEFEREITITEEI